MKSLDRDNLHLAVIDFSDLEIVDVQVLVMYVNLSLLFKDLLGIKKKISIT